MAKYDKFRPIRRIGITESMFGNMIGLYQATKSKLFAASSNDHVFGKVLKNIKRVSRRPCRVAIRPGIR